MTCPHTTITQRGGIVPQASDPPLPWAGRDSFRAVDGRTYEAVRLPWMPFVTRWR